MRFYILAILALFALSACGKKANNTNDTSGNCTSAYVADHNSVRNNLNFVKSSCDLSPASELCRTDRVAARKACDTYQATHKPGRSCAGFDGNLRKTDFNTTEVHETCNAYRARYGF